MERLGMVVEANEDLAKITLQRHTACSNCGGCGAAKGEAQNVLVEAVNKINAQTGDLVMVEIADKNVLFAAFLVYAVPVMGLLMGYILGHRLGIYVNRPSGDQAFGIIGGFLIMGISYLGLRWLNPRFSGSNRFVPVISKMVQRCGVDKGAGSEEEN